MLCAMCFGRCDQFNPDFPSVQCVNCRLFFHKECTYLKRDRQGGFDRATWLCNLCRRKRINKFSLNPYNTSIFGVDKCLVTNDKGRDLSHSTSLLRKITTNYLLTEEHGKSVFNIIQRLNTHTSSLFA